MDRHPCEKVGVDFFESAPSIHRARRELVATPDDVFDAFLDAEAWTRWAPPITRVEWTSGFPIEVGSTRAVSMWGGLVGYEEFLAYEHGVRMSFRFNEASKPGVRAFAEDYRVSDLGGGRCAVEWTMALDTGVRRPLIDRVVDPLLGAGVSFMLGRFAKLVESRARATPRP